MTEFEKVLQECLLDLEGGASDVGECLGRYPEHALALEPVLLTSLDLERGREARPSAAFKARVRGRLTQEMQKHPRKSVRFQFLVSRLATSAAMLVLALLVAGTVYAQGALPGQIFYQWKLTSETVWRAISPYPVGTDLAIAGRRADELIVLGNTPALQGQILNAYLEVVARLELEMTAENEARIRTILESQIVELDRSGISVPALEHPILPALEEPAAIPTGTPAPLPEIPQVNPTLPIPGVNPTVSVSGATSVPVQEQEQSNPTDVPKLIPSLPVDTRINSTIQVPSLIP